MRITLHTLTRLIALSLIVLSHARAEEFGPVYVVTYMEVASAATGTMSAALKKYAGTSRKAIGNLAFTALQRIERPNQFAIVAAWRDQRAIETHTGSETSLHFRNTLKPLSIAGYDERLHGALSVGDSRLKTEGIWAITHIDFIPPRKDDGIDAAKQLADASRRQIGNYQFDILLQANRSNHITFVEIWKNLVAVETHEMAVSTKSFREQILPMSGALYDQRLYRELN